MPMGDSSLSEQVEDGQVPMKRGKLWYHREPHAFLGGVQGLPAKQIAVYSITLDLIYANGGKCQNDPRWIAGWISDMGAASVRAAIAALCDRQKIAVEGDYLTNPRATTETTTKSELSDARAAGGAAGGRETQRKRRETDEKTAQFLPGFSLDRVGPPNKNNGLDQAHARYRVEKNREESSDTDVSDDKSLGEIIFGSGLNYLIRNGMIEAKARTMLGKWRKLYGEERLLEALRRSQATGASDPLAFVTGCLKQTSGPIERPTASDYIMADLKRKEENRRAEK